MLRKTDLARDSAARRRCFFDFRVAIAGAHARLAGANHKITCFQIAVKRPAHSADQFLRALLGYSESPGSVSDRSRLAIVHSNRMVRHEVIILESKIVKVPSALHFPQSDESARNR